MAHIETPPVGRAPPEREAERSARVVAGRDGRILRLGDHRWNRKGQRSEDGVGKAHVERVVFEREKGKEVASPVVG